MRLSSREIIAVAVSATLVVVTLFWTWVVDPMVNHLDQLDRQLLYKQDQQEKVIALSKEYSILKERIASTESRLKRSKNFSILSHLEGLARKMNVKKRIVQMKPKPGQNTRFYKESIVEISMEKVALPTLVRYLYNVENSPELLRVRELKIKPRFDNADLMDARFEISAYELSQESEG
jgi:general secretion pathway protein M